MFNLDETMWAGTDSSLKHALEIEATVMSRINAGAAEPSLGDTPHLLSKAGSVGIIAIKGPLMNIDSPWAAVFGVTTYPDIRRALVAAAQDQGVTQILLDVQSGGGHVAGVMDTGDMITKINNKVKPVTAFAGGIMASAAYWLGCSAGNIFSDRLAMVGSIGIIATHVERSKQLAADGITVTVIRAGKYKALASAVEPLSDAARAQIQNQIDACYEVFVQQVADSRGVSYEKADKTMAQGRDFIGAQAVDVGLVDSLSTFDAVLSKLQAKK